MIFSGEHLLKDGRSIAHIDEDKLPALEYILISLR